MTVVCSKCKTPRRDPDQDHPGVCVCGGFLDDISDTPSQADPVWTHGGKLQGSLLEDVRDMVEKLRKDRRANPLTLHLPDDAIVALGGDPNDYPELDSFPGVRVVKVDE